ncbi:MAG TPA: carboxypeptidase-like regulatory domain-containing protein, partial [Flavisolibacter sp.]|nr:carboxypeptidase-like regulatory domain-containing protein [Flavisolibacter sp.]
MLKRLLCLLAVTLLATTYAFSQSTTSSITGFVKGDTNEPLVGATVTVTHVPTGTVYRTVTKSEGKYDFGNLQPGGPYTITVSYVNFQNFTRDEVYLNL